MFLPWDGCVESCGGRVVVVVVVFCNIWLKRFGRFVVVVVVVVVVAFGYCGLIDSKLFSPALCDVQATPLKEKYFRTSFCPKLLYVKSVQVSACSRQSCYTSTAGCYVWIITFFFVLNFE